jgi:hypothetical protein
MDERESFLIVFVEDYFCLRLLFLDVALHHIDRSHGGGMRIDRKKGSGVRATVARIPANKLSKHTEMSGNRRDRTA